MKNLNIIFSVFVFFAFLSCEESSTISEVEGVDLKVEFTEEKSFLKYNDLNNSELGYSISTKNRNIKSVEIGLTIIAFTGVKSSRSVFETYTMSEFVNGTLVRSFHSSTVARKAGMVTQSGFNGNETLLFDVVVTLNNGEVYSTPNLEEVSGNYPNITRVVNEEGFTQFFSTFVGCPTNLVAGTYLGNATLSSLPCSHYRYNENNGLIDNQEITIRPTGYNTWRLSDVTRQYYGSYDGDQPISFQELCNQLIFLDNNESSISITANGVHNPSTNTIDIRWVNSGIMHCENIYILK